MLGEEAGALIEGVVAERDTRWRLARVDFDGGAIWLRDEGLAPGALVRVRVLARDVSIAIEAPPAGNSSIQNVLACMVQSIGPGLHESQVMVQLQCGSHTLLARITARAADQLKLAPGRPVWAQVKSAALLR
jgi:molybdate transport system ATP-binding protein